MLSTPRRRYFAAQAPDLVFLPCVFEEWPPPPEPPDPMPHGAGNLGHYRAALLVAEALRRTGRRAAVCLVGDSVFAGYVGKIEQAIAAAGDANSSGAVAVSYAKNWACDATLERTERMLQQYTKDFLSLKHESLTERRKLVEQLTSTEEGNASLKAQLAAVKQQAETEVHAVNTSAKTSTEKLSRLSAPAAASDASSVPYLCSSRNGARSCASASAPRSDVSTHTRQVPAASL